MRLPARQSEVWRQIPGSLGFDHILSIRYILDFISTFANSLCGRLTSNLPS